MEKNNYDKISVEDITKNYPFCAGVLICRNGKNGLEFLLTLANKNKWLCQQEKTVIGVGGIGGGQEPNEPPLDCAQREALEEISAKVKIISSDFTIFENLSTRKKNIKTTDAIKPFIFQKRLNTCPDKPFKKGLPIGQFLYIVMYLAKPLSRPKPKDVPALLWANLRLMNELLKGLKTEVIETKGELIKKPGFEIPGNALLKIPTPSTEELITRVFQKPSFAKNF